MYKLRISLAQSARGACNISNELRKKIAAMTKAGSPDPLGRVLLRKRIGSFVFVQHEYPELAERNKHSHPWLHLSIVQRGEYSRGLGSRISCYRAGSVALLPSDENHTDSYAPGSRCLHLVVPCELEQRLTRDFRKAGLKPDELTPSVAATSSIALSQEFRNPDSNSPLVVEALLLDLVSREFGVIAERSSYRPPWVRTVLDFLDDTFDQPWTLKGIADQIGVHPVYLCRAFSEHLNCTFGEYIRTLRILRGWQLLSLTAESLADIANESGFADQSHFTRLFKTKFGIAPGRYRRSKLLR